MSQLKKFFVKGKIDKFKNYELKIKLNFELKYLNETSFSYLPELFHPS